MGCGDQADQLVVIKISRGAEGETPVKGQSLEAISLVVILECLPELRESLEAVLHGLVLRLVQMQGFEPCRDCFGIVLLGVLAGEHRRGICITLEGKEGIFVLGLGLNALSLPALGGLGAKTLWQGLVVLLGLVTACHLGLHLRKLDLEQLVLLLKFLLNL